ncbi:reverse transcriptase domain-containing protein [bacterium]|nr:reverse transcriptase domain-containing protein [bacterium]
MPLFDFGAAFPSLSQRWMRTTLQHLKLPRGFTAVVLGMYAFALALVMQAGWLAVFMLQASGVLQGCPMSGSLFQLCMDPHLHRMQSVMCRQRSATIRACADDVGAVLRMLDDLIPLAAIFAAAASLSNLVLKASKCVIVVLSVALSDEVIAFIRFWLINNLPEWRDFIISDSAKYLWIILGPAAGREQWRSQVTKWLFRVSALGRLGGATAGANALLYNTRCFPVLEYECSFSHRRPTSSSASSNGFRASYASPHRPSHA